MKDAVVSSIIANLDFIIYILNRCFASADIENSIYCTVNMFTIIYV